ncbi:MAG: translation elongation factor 4 [Candidatus Moranbacteria bacterium]|nr:translation elongation factor 4 [Candidatus Moranbacteria bacterium]
MKNIRNFCIIAHIDHGKSTLSDRLLEVTGTVEKRNMKEQILDQMDLERERGITIKLQPVQMQYDFENTNYTLNLIDTPGHVDFAYEVSRSLAAVEGAVLLVDATQGVQAQTLSNLYFAIEQDLEIIPVLNKIDLPNADVEKVKREVIHVLGCDESDILTASGKTGEGVKDILKNVIEKVPSPKGDPEGKLRALIFDSVYDSYKGVLAYVRIVDGEVKNTDDIHMMITSKDSNVVELGHFFPQYESCDILKTGDIGYIATGFKSVSECRVGDTITLKNSSSKQTYDDVKTLPGYKEVKPMVYASFYPQEGNEYNAMRDALEKLTLNDGAFRFEPESNKALGRGFRCGFLGLLHLEIIQARLEREFNFSPTITTPSVIYKLKLKENTDDELVNIYSPTELPDPSTIEHIEEPYVNLEIITPAEYLGSVMELMGNMRVEYKNTNYIDDDRVQLIFDAPLMDVIVDFYDQLKSVSSGYASMNYEISGYRKSDLVKLDILVAGDAIDAFSRIVPKDKAFYEGKATVDKLKDVIPRQNFAVAIQAAIGAKVIARTTISAFRKDVTAGLYGGDITRKRKLLEKQKKGKKRMAQSGKVDIPPEAFLQVLRK